MVKVGLGHLKGGVGDDHSAGTADFGDRDFTSVEEAAMIFHSIPGAQLCILPGVGHGTFRDRPEWLNPIILDFLDRK
ncbi:MAG: alpha/beta hydrolase [Bryobacteraceae bacterium]